MVEPGAGAARVDQPAIRIVIAEQQGPQPGPRAFGVGPPDHHEFFAVQALDLQPESAIAGSVGRFDPLRDDPFYFQGAGMVVESLPATDLVIAEMQRRACIGQQGRTGTQNPSDCPVEYGPQSGHRSSHTSSMRQLLKILLSIRVSPFGKAAAPKPGPGLFWFTPFFCDQPRKWS